MEGVVYKTRGSRSLMMTSLFWTWVRTTLVLGVTWSGLLAASVAPRVGDTWRYQLLHESGYIDDCPVCDRPTLKRPLRGSFLLTPEPVNPLYARYTLTQVRLAVGGGLPGGILLEGSGVLEVEGEVAVTQRLILKLTVRTDMGTEEVEFDSGHQPGEPQWPWIQLSAVEQKPSATRILNLQLDTMPIRDLWFSTRSGFTAQLGDPSGITISPSDLISDQGHVVVSQSRLRSALRVSNAEPLGNLDAAFVAAGGGFGFSLGSDIQSATLGMVHHGDLVSLQGGLLKSYADFDSALGPQPPIPDLGLDAVFQQADGSYLFSIQKPTFSETLGVIVGRGDLVSTTGRIVATASQLLKVFHPLHPDQDYGLDSVFVWPTGEIWFSTEEAVPLEGGFFLSDGDLVSSTGRIVYRNLELLDRFGPLEDAANFGLDALVVATDVGLPDVQAPVVRIRVDSAGNTLVLEWTAPGRFFQVEQSDSPLGPFRPVTPIVLAQDQVLPTSRTASFYRVIQW